MSASAIKTLARIKGSMESGAYYEAQQMYKSSYHRCKAKQQLDDAVHILQEGAVTQLSHGQVTCGVELGMLLLEGYTAASTPADEASVSRVLGIIRAFPVPQPVGGPSARQGDSPAFPLGSASPQVDECARLVAAAVKWANKSGASLSSRRIHSAFAFYLWRSFGPEGVGRALTHFVRGSNDEEFAEVLHACARQGPPGEVDLWLLRAVLQILSAAHGAGRYVQVGYAKSVFEAFVARSGPLDTPTAHFTELMLLALENAPVSPCAHGLFTLARERYGDGVLRRDDGFGPWVDRVESTFFNIGRHGALGTGLGGLFGDLLKSLTEVA